MAVVHNKIRKNYIILCEGKDTENFLIQYLNSEPLKIEKRFSEDIQTFDFGGINQLTMFMRTLMNMEGFDKVDRLLVMRDAETNVEQAEIMVRNSFSECGLSVPDSCCSWNKTSNLHTAYLLLPSCDNKPVPGALEDLCWDIISDKDAERIKNDIEKFTDKIKSEYGRIVSHEHKSKLHTYFSVNDDLVSLKVGEAARSGAFDWNSARLELLKQLIHEGFFT